MTASMQAPAHFQEMIIHMSQRSVATDAPHIVPYLKPHSKIIDVGCSAGSITIDLAQRVPKGHVVGVDIDSKAIDQAKELAKAMNVTNVSFQVGSATDLSSFEPGHFDIAHAHQVILHLSRGGPVKALQEMARVVKSNNGIIATRDQVYMEYIAGGPNMTTTRSDFWTYTGGYETGGRMNHIWARQAGFEWRNIEMGSVAWDICGVDKKTLWAKGAKRFSRTMGLREGLRGEAFYNQMDQEFDEWVRNDAGRVLALDSWVIAKK